MSLVVAGCLLLLIVNDNIRAEKQQQSAVDQQTNNLKILRVIKESPAGPTFHNWDISIEILNPGPYEMLVVDISGSQTDEPWSSECSAISAWSGTLLFGIPQPDSEESTWYACKIKEAYKASLWKRSWGIQVSMFEHSIRESPVGSSWRKIR
ncbi:MAG TPA: hypothetical protein VLE44_01890 [Candidatus Saccharimonadales bacterium]|nr:hypothetical protein [Candidatus Saccharimonadales bacterium]